MKAFLFPAIALLIVSSTGIICHAQVFDVESIALFSREVFSNISVVDSVDFDGNGAHDWVISNNNFDITIADFSFTIILSQIHPVQKGTIVHGTRNIVQPKHPSLSANSPVLKLQDTSSGAAKPVILSITKSNLIKIIHENNASLPTDNFEISEHTLNSGEYTQIKSAITGWFYGAEPSQDLFLIASDGASQRAFLFSDLKASFNQNTLSPVESYEIAPLDSTLFSGPISMQGKDALFFQSQGQWRLWQPSAEAGFADSDGSVKQIIDIPAGVQSPVDVLFRPGRPYPLMASVNTADNSAAYVAWPEAEGTVNFNAPQVQTLPVDKDPTQPTRLFEMQLLNNAFPLLVAQRPSQQFNIYKIEEEPELTPVLRQEIDGAAFRQRPDAERPDFLHHVEQVGNFNGDAVTDLMFFLKNPDEEFGTYITLFGNPAQSGVDHFENFK